MTSLLWFFLSNRTLCFPLSLPAGKSDISICDALSSPLTCWHCVGPAIFSVQKSKYIVTPAQTRVGGFLREKTAAQCSEGRDKGGLVSQGPTSLRQHRSSL